MKPEAARVWEEDVVIPTYGVGAPDRNPMFLEKRIYQGSSGAVYPFAVIDKIFDEKHDQTYRAVFLENKYLKIMILPQLGGRIQMLFDKTNNYHCVYYNRVIKPALVGLTGPWISGGIEFNWPQHHRPSTFMPIEYAIRQNDDGSATCLLGEIDRMHGTQMSAALTLHPGAAFLQIDVKLFNRTSLPQTFLWWANPACAVDENHQSVFPPDVHAVMDHGKRDVSTFPIATGKYYKVNYAPGTDISRYKNIPVPTSYMAYHSDFNFVASYDHGRRAGLLHVADHHVSPGKKQWTWGNGDFGKAWDRQLTDEDGPYIELMCGVFTDNQPDFSWLNPYEEKSFTQYFMPYKQVGRIKNASERGAINLEVENGEAYIAAYVTQRWEKQTVSVILKDAAGNKLFEEAPEEFTPETLFERTVPLPEGTDPNQLEVGLFFTGSVPILTYKPVKVTMQVPSPAKAALPPAEIGSTEQLFVAGQHLEQYRHATFDPERYYREAIRRDPADARNNNALGLLLYRRGLFEEAEPFFRRATETLTQRNPNPADGEPHYNLGLCLQMQGRLDEAFDAFYKSTWSAAMQAQGFFSLAQVASRRGNPWEAVRFADLSLRSGWHNHRARNLKTIILRQCLKKDEARREAELTLSLDPLNAVAQYELQELRKNSVEERVERFRAEIAKPLCGSPEKEIEKLLEYIIAGLDDGFICGDASVLTEYTVIKLRGGQSAMFAYLAGWGRTLKNDAERAAKWFTMASEESLVGIFPHRLEEMLALQAALKFNPSDGHAAYLLGNIWYSKRVYDRAIVAWELAARLLPDFPTVHRNLGLAYFNKRHDPESSRRSMERAFDLDQTDARVLFELDQLYKMVRRAPAERFAFLEKHEPLIQQRDDLYIERIQLLNLLGEFDRVQELLAARNFHPWEGGEGKVSGAYIASLLGIAIRQLKGGDFTAAIETIDRARVYPHNLGEGKLYGALENDLDYFAGLAWKGLGDQQAAKACFERAAAGSQEPVSAMFYNDQPPHMIYFQGLALRELRREADAKQRFQKLLDFGQKHLHDHITIDYFAVSLPEFLVFDDDLDRRNEIHCRYMMALGYRGLGEEQNSGAEICRVLELEPSHWGATLQSRFI